SPPPVGFLRGAARRPGGGPGEPAAHKTPKRVESPPPVFVPSSKRNPRPAEEPVRSSPGTAPARPEGADPSSEPVPGRDAGAGSEPAPRLVPKTIPLPAAPP